MRGFAFLSLVCGVAMLLSAAADAQDTYPSVIEDDQFSQVGAHSAGVEQHLTDAPKDAGPAGEPAGDIERRRHRHGARHVDPPVGWADAIKTTEGAGQANAAPGTAPRREPACAPGRSVGAAARE